MFVLLLIRQATTELQVEQIDKSPGLFFKRLGEAKICNQHLTLLHFINTTTFKENLDTATRFYHKSYTLCSMIPSNHSNAAACKLQQKLLVQQLTEIKSLINTVQSHNLQFDKPTTTKTLLRKRRGLLNAGSKILKWLVGTPDSDDSEFYTNSINSLIDDRKTTHLMMKDQIKILSDTMNTLNKTLETIQDAEQELNANINSFNKFINKSSAAINENSLEIEILDHLLLIKQINDINIRQLQSYSMTLTLIRHGIIDYNIINPTTLYNELKQITSLSLPIKIEPENIEYYYQIMDVKAFIKESTLVILIKIPIAQISEYNLFQVFPLPTPHKNSSQISYITIDYPYLLSSRSKSQFALLKQLDKCIRLNDLYICKHIDTMERRSTDICELEMFDLENQIIPKSCKTTTIIAQPEIWQQVSENQWLFILSKLTKGTLLCNTGADQEQVLNGMGLLKITGDCRFITNNIILQPEISIRNVTAYLQIPQINILEDDCCKYLFKEEKLSPEQLKPIKLRNLDLNEIKYTQHQLKKMDENLQTQLNKPFIIKYENTIYKWLCYIGGGMASIIILYYTYKYGIFKVFATLFSKMVNCLLPCKKKNGDTFNFYNCLFGENRNNQVQPYETKIIYEPNQETVLLQNRRREPSESSSISGRRPIRQVKL